ncbi:hypothetical protein BLNAU_25299 [Blattamonas nauphoetae]|uniref:Transposase n=1 Tax=Blattamonas nauphoetae TaxID=2049346 RepID=A0ABQ9WLY4_9EUKA|nr:hypothetical protein BLNAU_25299 [Blattamonas nauphoetae]
MGVKIIDLEYATLKSPDGHDRDFVYYHVCGADGKAKKNTKTGVLCTYAKQIPICEAAKHKELQEQPRNRRFPGLEDVVVDSRLDLLAGTRQPFTLADSPLLRRHEEILISVGQKTQTLISRKYHTARSVATIIDKATENGLTIASVVSDSAASHAACL